MNTQSQNDSNLAPHLKRDNFKHGLKSIVNQDRSADLQVQPIARLTMKNPTTKMADFMSKTPSELCSDEASNLRPNLSYTPQKVAPTKSDTRSY